MKIFIRAVVLAPVIGEFLGSNNMQNAVMNNCHEQLLSTQFRMLVIIGQAKHKKNEDHVSLRTLKLLQHEIFTPFRTILESKEASADLAEKTKKAEVGLAK